MGVGPGPVAVSKAGLWPAAGTGSPDKSQPTSVIGIIQRENWWLMPNLSSNRPQVNHQPVDILRLLWRPFFAHVELV